jgi:hypothetical protein
MNVRRLLRLAPLSAALAVWTCDLGPKAGNIPVELIGPQTSLGAASFLATALDPFTIEDVTAACRGCTVYVTRVSDTEVRGIVTGRFGSELLLNLVVSDRDARDPYAVRLLELAAPDYDPVTINGSSLRLQ